MRAKFAQLQNLHLKTQPREERKLVNFLGATFTPIVVL